MGADNSGGEQGSLDDLELDLDLDLDESTRIVTRGAAPSVFDDATRVVAKANELDDATRVVTRRAAAGAPLAPVLPAPVPPSPVPRAAERAAADPVAEPVLAPATPEPAFAAPAVAERYFPAPAAAPAPEPELDESTRIVRRSSAAPAAPAHAADESDDDATRIVRRAPAVPAPDVPTPGVAAPATMPESSDDMDDDATRIVRRPVHDAEPLDDSTRIVRRAVSVGGAAAGSGPDESAGEDTRAIVRTGASAQRVAETPQPAVTVPTASAIQAPPEREIYSPRAVPEQQELQRTHIEASSRPPVVAESAGAQARRRLVLAVSAIAGVAVLGAVIVAAVVLIAAL